MVSTSSAIQERLTLEQGIKAGILCFIHWQGTLAIYHAKWTSNDQYSSQEFELYSHTQTFNFGNLLFTWEENGLQQLTSDRNILLSLLTYITESLFSATAGGIVFRSSVCFPQCLWTSLSLVFYRFDKICFCVSLRLKAHLFHQLWKCFQLFSNVSLTFCSLTQILLLALNSQSQALSLWDSFCFYWPVL